MRLSGRLRAGLGMVILGLGLWYWHGTRPSVTVPSQEDAQAASSLRSLTQQPSTLLTRLDEVSRHATESHAEVVAPFLENLPEIRIILTVYGIPPHVSTFSAVWMRRSCSTMPCSIPGPNASWASLSTCRRQLARTLSLFRQKPTSIG